MFWLILFVTGSALWFWATPWADVMGRLIVFVATFIGVSLSWRTESRFMVPRMVAGVQLVNLLPMFVLGSVSQASHSALLKAAFVAAAVAALGVNSYVVLSPRRKGAA